MATITAVGATSGGMPTARAVLQHLTVIGTNFPTGLQTVQLTPPVGPVLTPQVSIPAAATSFIVSATLTTPGNWTVAIADASRPFLVQPAPVPAVAQIIPVPLTAYPGPRLFTVIGTGIQPGMTASVTAPSGTVLPVSVQSVSSGSFGAAANLNEMGSYRLTVNNGVGGVSAPFTFQVTAPPAPQITGTLPATLVANAAAQSVQVTGANFYPPGGLVPTTATLAFTRPDGTTGEITPLPGRVLSGPMLLDTPGTLKVQVFNVYDAASNVFEVTVQPAPDPVITRLTPSVPGARAQAQLLAVDGTGFQSGMTATVTVQGGTPVDAAVSNVSPSRCQVSAVLDTATGYTLQLSVPGTNPSSPFAFQVQDPPDIRALSPASPVASATAQVVRVSGSGFAAGLSAVLGFGASRTPLTPQQISNVTPTGFDASVVLAAPGGYSLQATNPGGATGSALPFTVLPAPRISGTTPLSLATSPAPQQLQVQGSDFLAGVTATLKDPAGQDVPGQVQSVTSAAFTLAGVVLGMAGTYSLTVTNPNGGVSNAWTFQVQAAPQVTAITPAQPSTRGGRQRITVSGSGFQAGLTVALTGPVAGVPTISRVTPTQFLMDVALQVRGAYTLQVSNPVVGQSNVFPFTVS